jgi:hypothetical protein
VLPLNERRLSILVLLPAAYVLLFVFSLKFFRQQLLAIAAHGHPLWYLLLAVHVLVGVTTVMVLIVLSAHVAKNSNISKLLKVVWLVCLWTLGAFAAPIYFYVHMRHSP